MSKWGKHRGAPIGVGLLCAALAAVGAGPPASAQETTEQLAPVMVTLDASGSMAQAMPEGGTRMDSAKTALTGLVDGLDAEARLGLQVYGSQTGESPEEKAAGCEDIVTAEPVGPVDKQALSQTIDGIEPSGYTPIGAALRAAADELPDEGPRAVVLISDGIDTCAPPDPCEVAEELDAEGVELSVHAVGFQVDDEARSQLTCLADATGGSYTDATDAGELEEQLPQVVNRAQRTYEAQGTPITGTEDFPGAPAITAGQYVDTIDAGQTKYYSLSVPEGYTAHVAATAIIPGDESDAGVPRLYTRLFDPARKNCDETFDIAAMWQAHLTSTISWNAEENAGSCAAKDELYFSVEREGPDDTKFWTYDMELMVTLEPPVDGDTGPAANSTFVPFEEPSGPEQGVTGGGSFNDAVELPGSGVYTDEMALGEMATYKVELDWGESLAVQTNVDSRGIDDVITVDTSLRSSLRKRTSESATSELTLHDEQNSGDPVEMTRVLYNNREDGYPAVAGWYYITLESDPGESNETMPVRLSVSKGGEAVEAPDYVSAEGLPEGPVTESGGKQGAGAQRDDVVRTARVEEKGLPAWGWILIAGAGAAVLTGGGLLAFRGRTHR
ncbi:hypothetical protein BAY61_11815 [Prauserella marina]|uniref:Ca-activated chloride channel family protein n=1 Tax=Prauserella marina TaxID=530584 RepID=A0A222VPC6_9PSEU|nr:VWA domain-containing protein [Prauserella marina]ASR35571.1 hypothetical protein BAY61_11815 [Prauserella marina]PWV84581.1 Ca-activated chloride channel family protein [Prauserella marina]SDC18627.1 Ca-activated chloride channel family protein [Prauserella marina]